MRSKCELITEQIISLIARYDVWRSKLYSVLSPDNKQIIQIKIKQTFLYLSK